MRYQHTQQGTTTRVCMGFGVVFCFVVAMTSGSQPWVRVVLLCMCGLFLFLTWLFGSLTVEVDDEELRHWFGPGFWKKSYQLLDIESSTVVRNSWFWGWGIRLTPNGWLYNVSGLDAVQLQLRSGRKLRIGTDDPQGLVEAISHD